MFTDRPKAVLLLRILFVMYVSCLSCCLVCSLQPCGHLLGKGWPLGVLVCDVFLCFVTFPCGALGQVWCLIVSITDLCLLPYFPISLGTHRSDHSLHCLHEGVPVAQRVLELDLADPKAGLGLSPNIWFSHVVANM